MESPLQSPENQRIAEMESEIKKLKTQCWRTEFWAVCGLVISVFKLMQPITTHAQPAPSNLNSVQIGNASKEKPQREFLNSDEVGEREGVSSRTVTSWIEQGRIYPQPTRQGRAWTIAANYRLLPINTELTENK